MTKSQLWTVMLVVLLQAASLYASDGICRRDLLLTPGGQLVPRVTLGPLTGHRFAVVEEFWSFQCPEPPENDPRPDVNAVMVAEPSEIAEVCDGYLLPGGFIACSDVTPPPPPRSTSNGRGKEYRQRRCRRTIQALRPEACAAEVLLGVHSKPTASGELSFNFKFTSTTPSSYQRLRAPIVAEQELGSTYTVANGKIDDLVLSPLCKETAVPSGFFVWRRDNTGHCGDDVIDAVRLAPARGAELWACSGTPVPAGYEKTTDTRIDAGCGTHTTGDDERADGTAIRLIRLP
jgi:hypothetical protein